MNFPNLTKLFGFLLLLTVCFACSDDEANGGGTTTEEPRARFTPVQSADNSFMFSFVNESINADTYAWDFGDGVGTSTEEAPSYTYSAEGTFTVQLTATGEGGVHVSTVDISVTDPNAQRRIITGESTKTWKLLRDISAGDEFPMLVGPNDRSQIWWAYGLNDPIGSRPCIMEEEYIFGADGSYEYRTDGTVFADFGIWNVDIEGSCVDETVASNMVNVDGADISAWGSNAGYTFEFDNMNNTLTVSGIGAHVGLPKVGTGAEFNTPQPSVVYNIVTLEDNNGVDKMVLETSLDAAGGYWSFTLVSYDDPSLEPELPGAPPSVGFESSIDGNTVTFTNTSNNADSFTWDFGDGNMSSEESPVHTYAGDGAYTVVLTGFNADGEATATTDIIITSQTFSAAVLDGGSSKTWRLNPGASALAVGPGKGSGEWFATNADDVNVRACSFDDEFTFDNAGAFTYNANGDVWGEAYMGISPDGCVDESALVGGAEAWASGNHTFTVTEANGDTPAFLTVQGTGAFIALPKAFNGGEHQSAATIPVDGEVTYEVLSYVNGADGEILRLTIDISENQVGGAWWTFTLIAE